MNHIALDRPRADDRHLNGEVIKFFWLKPRQHVHLRPAFDLKDTDAVTLC